MSIMIWRNSLNHQLTDRKKTEEITITKTTATDKLGKALLEEVEKYDEINRRNNKMLADIVKSKAVDGSTATIFANPKSFFH